MPVLFHRLMFVENEPSKLFSFPHWSLCVCVCSCLILFQIISVFVLIENHVEDYLSVIFVDEIERAKH